MKKVNTKEDKVAQYLKDGLSTKEISKLLDISMHHVRVIRYTLKHKKEILRKQKLYRKQNLDHVKQVIRVRCKQRNAESLPTAVNNYQYWTIQQDRVILDRSLSELEAARLTGRTVLAVRHRRVRLRKLLNHNQS